MGNEKESTVWYRGEKDTLEKTVKALAEGNVMVLPCDTIYGICARIGQEEMEAIYSLKERDPRKPLLQLATKEQAEEICMVPSDILSAWPCALTAIMKRKDGNGTLALRVPDDPFLQKVLARLGSPIYSTSVNISGHATLTSITDIILLFNGKIPYFVVSQEKQGTVPSTLLDCTVHPYHIVRNGSYDASALIR